MDWSQVNVETQYQKDENLKKEEVKSLIEWVEKQPHLPEINELQAIFFLHSCYCNSEAAKNTIENFFTLKTKQTDIFTDKNPFSEQLTAFTDICLMTVLPRRTPQDHAILFVDFLTTNSKKFHHATGAKLIDMTCMLHLHQEGISDGFLLVINFANVTLGHVLKLRPFVMKGFINYLQEAIPVRLKGLHIFNTFYLMDRVLALMRPFMKKELAEMLFLHKDIEGLKKHVPVECLPEDYGGCEKKVEILQEEARRKLEENAAFFKWEESLKVDEKKRL